MRATLTLPPIQGCRSLRPPSGTHPLCFRPRNLTWQCPRFKITSNGAGTFGTRPGLLSSAPRRVIVVLPTVTGWWGPLTNPFRGYGSPPVTSRSRPRPVSSLPASSVLIIEKNHQSHLCSYPPTWGSQSSSLIPRLPDEYGSGQIIVPAFRFSCFPSARPNH